MTRFRTPGEIAPPTPDDYMRALDLTMLSEDITTGVDVLSVIGKHRQHESSYNYYVAEVAVPVGAAIEPYDKQLGQAVDIEMKIAHAVICGMAFGRLFVPRAHDPVVQLGDMVPVFPEALAAIEDDNERNQTLGRYFVDCGEKGVDLMNADTVDQLEQLEQEVSGAVGAQRFFRTGCGIVAYSALRAHAYYNALIVKQDQQAFRRQVDTGAEIDWDAELHGLAD